jgi:hypothetical protein
VKAYGKKSESRKCGHASSSYTELEPMGMWPPGGQNVRITISLKRGVSALKGRLSYMGTALMGTEGRVAVAPHSPQAIMRMSPHRGTPGCSDQGVGAAETSYQCYSQSVRSNEVKYPQEGVRKSSMSGVRLVMTA